MATKIKYYFDNNGPMTLRGKDQKPVQSFEEAVAVLSTIYHLGKFDKIETPMRSLTGATFLRSD